MQTDILKSSVPASHEFGNTVTVIQRILSYLEIVQYAKRGQTNARSLRYFFLSFFHGCFRTHWNLRWRVEKKGVFLIELKSSFKQNITIMVKGAAKIVSNSIGMDLI